MASYRPITLPAVDALRSYVLSALARGGATVYQRSDDPTDGAEVREVWAPGTTGLVQLPDPLPPGWDVIAAP